MNEEEKRAALEAEKAEVRQAIKALLIPLSLFLSTVIFAAGVFLIYNSEPLGWAFIATTAIVATWAIVTLVQFQNSYRVKGMMPDKEDIMIELDQNNEPKFENEPEIYLLAPPPKEEKPEPVVEPESSNEETVEQPI